MGSRNPYNFGREFLKNWIRDAYPVGELGLISPTCNATLTRIFLFFFWVGPPRVPKLMGWARPVSASLQAVKKFIFIFFLNLGLNGSIPVAGPSYT